MRPLEGLTQINEEKYSKKMRTLMTVPALLLGCSVIAQQTEWRDYSPLYTASTVVEFKFGISSLDQGDTVPPVSGTHEWTDTVTESDPAEYPGLIWPSMFASLVPVDGDFPWATSAVTLAPYHTYTISVKYKKTADLVKHPFFEIYEAVLPATSSWVYGQVEYDPPSFQVLDRANRSRDDQLFHEEHVVIEESGGGIG